MKKVIFTFCFAALCAVYGNATTYTYQTPWSSGTTYNTGDIIQNVPIPNIIPAIYGNFICRQPTNVDPSIANNGWAWAIFYDGTTAIQFIPGGYEYKAGTKVYEHITPSGSTSTQYVFDCLQDNQTDPASGTWAWSVDNATTLPLLSGYRYAYPGTMAYIGSSASPTIYTLTSDCYPPQLTGNGVPQSWAWSTSSANSQLWVPSLSPTLNPTEDISRYGNVILKPAIGYGNQMTLSNTGITLISDNTPQTQGVTTTTISANGFGLDISTPISTPTSNSHVRLNNDGTLNLIPNGVLRTAISVGDGVDPSSYTVSSVGDVVSNSETTGILQVNGNATIGKADIATRLTVNGTVITNGNNTTSGNMTIGKADIATSLLTVNGTVITNGDNTTSGNVTIGTAGATTPNTLTVNGNIIATGLTASSTVYTDASNNLTTTAPTSGAAGFWSRDDATGILSPAKTGDNITVNGATTTSGITNNGDFRLGQQTGNFSMNGSGTFAIDASGNFAGRFYVDNNGTVGIGIQAGMQYPTLNSNYKLAVNGAVLATSFEVLAYSNWQDYVFGSDYKLRSLKETEAYINKNKHLPDVPSADEVKTKGINVVDMDATLLKKVEELTLYIIDLQKQLDATNAELAKMKQK